jgi:protoporphyrinogen/coproporphyrinogen III oxidase
MNQSDVLIVGAGISGLTLGYRLQEQGKKVLLLEQQPHTGGVLRSSRAGGYVFDWAANGVLNNVPETLALVRDLGLELLPAAPSAKQRFLWHGSKLHTIPTTPPALLGSSLFSPLEKLRLLSEMFVPKNPADESVFDFVARRFGRGVAEKIAQAGVGGITAGDAKSLGVMALFPRLKALEMQHGSLLRGLFKTPKPATPTQLCSFAGGMQALPDALAARLEVRTNHSVQRIETFENGYLVFCHSQAFFAKNVVLATPAFVSAALLEELAPSVAAQLASIQYAPAWVFGLAYRREVVPHSLDGFGFLRAGKDIRSLGVLFTSSVFPSQAPDGTVYVRVIAGGALDSGFLELPFEAALALVKSDLERSLGISAEPMQVQHQRWKKAIPQYGLGHHPPTLPTGLHLLSNAFGGVGVNDCIRNATQLAQHLDAQIAVAAVQ